MKKELLILRQLLLDHGMRIVRMKDLLFIYKMIWRPKLLLQEDRITREAVRSMAIIPLGWYMNLCEQEALKSPGELKAYFDNLSVEGQQLFHATKELPVEGQESVFVTQNLIKASLRDNGKN